MGIDLTEWLAAQQDPEFKDKVEQMGQAAEAGKREEKRQEKMRAFLLLPHVEGRAFSDPKRSGFVNPYTFFPIEDEPPWRERPSVDYCGHTGKLACTLEVREDSALFIPNTTGCFKHGDHKSYDFYSHEDLSDEASRKTTLKGVEPPKTPIVPGSEIRGMVRSVYEQLTNSCLPVIDEKNNPIKRTSLPKKPFRMEYDAAERCWKLYATEVYHLGAEHKPDSYRYEGGELAPYQAVYITASHQYGGKRPGVSGAYVDEISDDGAAGGVKAYVHLTGSMRNKHVTLFPAENAHAGEEPLCTVPAGSGLMARFERVLDAYCARTTEGNHNEAVGGYMAYRDRYRSGQVVLVYADSGTDPRFLSPSCISPESFDTTVLDLLEAQASHDPCKGPFYCPACRLFGAIGDERPVGSRVRFGDAEPEAAYGWEFDAPTTLAPLSTPRASATEFYLKQPSLADGTGAQGMWNFDYLLSNGKKTAPYKDMKDAGIQGRKVYWHFPFDLQQGYDKGVLQPSSQNITVRPLRRGKFDFTVYFENLSDSELANLIFAIGGMGNGRLQKLGHGKPLGMGSVLVKVEGCETRRYAIVGGAVASKPGEIIDRNWVDGKLAEIDGSVLSGGRDAARRELIEVHAQPLSTIPMAGGGKSLGDVVSYPKPRPGRVSQANAIFEWFKRNRGTVQNPSIHNTLSPISIEDIQNGALE